MIPFALLLPLLAAMLVITLDADRTRTKYTAFAGSVVSLALLPFIDSGASSFAWFAVNGTQISITASITPLSYMLLFVVLLIGALVFAYSFEFMNLPSEWKRYYVEMLAFETAMLTFAMAGNFVLFFIAWEFLSLTSYLLIGFWHGRDRAIAAARKAMTIVLIGDVALFASIIIFQSTFGTLTFGGIINGLGVTSFPEAACLLLVIAIITKSAQFPFHEWLPDAMEGPTPASAYLHSTTMVKAGVFAAIVLYPVLYAGNAMVLLFAAGMLTALLGMFNAMRERNVKRVLAYSTVQELGLMLVAVSSNALLAAIYFFFAQSFYKALLFFSAGVAMKANDREDINELSGISKNKIVYFTTLFGVLALVGFIPFDGFFANVGIASAFSANLVVYAIISLVGLGTSFYMFRWVLVQDRRATNPRVSLNYNSVPNSTSYSMLILASLSIAAGAAFFFLPQILSVINFVTYSSSLAPGLLDAIIETVIAAEGALLAYRIYKASKANPSKKITRMFLRSYEFVYTAGIFNAAYVHIAAFATALAGGAEHLDARLSDMFDWFGHVTASSGNLARRLATGGINTYVAMFVVGLLIIIATALVI